jgi:hypothetical protein
LTSLNRTGKGIILLHDFQEATAKGALALLGALKAGGYKVVHIKPKIQLETLDLWEMAGEGNLIKRPMAEPPAVPRNSSQ